MKVGMVLGRFSPIHNGHVYMIEEVAKKVDKLYVAVCFTDGETVPASVRANWVDNALNHIKKVQVEIIYEQIGSSPDGRIADHAISFKWAEYLKRKYPDITHFGGGSGYVKMMADAIGAESILVDLEHKKYTISSAKIRNNLELLKGNCIDLVKEQYIPRIAIVGIESVGKSTLSKIIAEKLNGEFIDEYGRIYCEIHAPLEEGKDYFLTKKDFHNIALGHNRLVLRAYERALKKGKKLVVVDTEHIVTQAFFQRYLGGYYQKLHEMCNFQSYDIYFYLEPLDLEDDGTRRVVSNAERDKQNAELLDMFQRRNDINNHFYIVKQMPLAKRVEFVLDVINKDLREFILC